VFVGKGAFPEEEKKTSKNVELCLLLLAVTFTLPTNLSTSSGNISGIYFDNIQFAVISIQRSVAPHPFDVTQHLVSCNELDV
jgi:hypothetical protein